jgi:hypothetical protein
MGIFFLYYKKPIIYKPKPFFMARLKLRIADFIKDSKDYDALERLSNFNRNVTSTQVKKLIDSMKDFGCVGTVIAVRTRAFSGGKPVEYIIDGQHRITAARRLGEPFSCLVYEFEDDTRMNVCKFMASLNSNSKQWSSDKYLNMYAELGLTEYILFQKTKKETGLTKTDLLNVYLFGNSAAQDRVYKDGTMTFPNLKKSEQLLNAVMKVKELMPNKAFVRRGLFRVMHMTDGKYNKMAVAIKKTLKAYELANMPVPCEERPFEDWLIGVYKSTFGDK